MEKVWLGLEAGLKVLIVDLLMGLVCRWACDGLGGRWVFDWGEFISWKMCLIVLEIDLRDLRRV